MQNSTSGVVKTIIVLFFCYFSAIGAVSAQCSGNALNFSGAAIPSNIISIENSDGVSLNKGGYYNFTLSTWLYVRSTAQQNILFHGKGCSSWASWFLGIGGGESNDYPGKIVFGFRSSNAAAANQIASPSTVPLNTWVHVAIVYDGASIIMYLNGTSVKQINYGAPVPRLPWSSPEKLYIGADPGCGTRNYFNGMIDELAIFSSSNSSSEILSWYNKLITPSHPMYNSLLSYWQFDEDASNQLVWSSAGGYNYGVASSPVPRATSTVPIVMDPGSITNAHTVPYPQENSYDFIQNSVSSLAGVYAWEQSPDNATWTAATGSSNSATYTIPNISTSTYFRRTTTCASKTATAPVLIKVFNQSNVQNGQPSKNGSITGFVKSKSGAGVSGITVRAQKNVAVKGSPQSYIYTTTTDGNGKYTFSNIFYGDKDNGDPASVNFTITPFKTNHSFDPATYSPQPLSYDVYNVQLGPNFTDTTVLTVTGNVSQTCQGCLNTASIPVPVNTMAAGVDSAKVTGGDLPAYAQPTGNYSTTIQDQGNRTFTPSYKNHKFSPVSRTQNITDNTGGISFSDTTTYTISGKLTAGGGDYIGQAVLLFTDTASGRAVTFRKRDTTRLNTGAFSVRLPARRYKVSIESFNPSIPSTDSAYVSANDLGTYFNTIVPKDSLIADIDTSNVVLNLVYHRAPVLQILGLKDTTCSPVVVFKQNVVKTFIVNVFEGPVSKGVRINTNDNTNKADSLMSSDSVRILTDVQDITGTAPPENLQFRLKKGMDTVMLKPGVPNISYPFNKIFQVYYTDKYGRAATPVVRDVVVTGIQSPPQTFVTTSPTVPLLVLHRPPGDGSYSFWEQTKSVETAMRMSVAKGGSATGYEEIKIGAKFSAGIGVQIETEVVGSLNATIGTTVTNTTDNEAIITNSTTTKYTTKQGGILGSAGDVYIGGAINFKYGVSNVVQFNNSCALNLTEQLIVAPDSIKTIYSYSEDHIANTIMPTLQYFISKTTGAQKSYYQNQLNVWQQVIDNNKNNKQTAAFVENRSFDGNSGGVEVSKTFSKSNSNTVSFNLELESEIAAKIGAEVNGSGVEGGVTVGFKMETGNSKTNTSTTETTTGYFLGDKDAGDYYSVDVKTDPVYGTPAFALVAGTSSCPPEPGAQSRDNSQIIIPRPIRTNISNAADTALFTVNLVNKSESREARTYLFNANKSSYNGIVVSVDGITLGSTVPIPFTLNYLESKAITVKLQRNDPSLYSFEGIEFTLTDNCDGSVQGKNYITANFVNPCGIVNLVTPENNWVSASSDSSVIPVTFNGYTLSSLDSISLEYSKTGSSNWNTGFTLQRFQITDPTTTTYNWGVSSLPDSVYNFRLKLVCTGGSVYYTPRVTGVLDRTSPSLLGKPQPSDDMFVRGDEISFTYNENINTNGLNNNVVLRRMSNDSIIATSVSGYGNKMIIMPLADLSTFNGDSILVIVNNVSDLYGNLKPTPDTSKFYIGTAPIVNGVKPVKVYMVRPSMKEDSLGKMEVHFKLPSKATKLTKVYFNTTGSATYNNDYTASMDTLQVLVDTTFAIFQPVYGYYNGAQGYIYINRNSSEAVLKLDPVADSIFESDENINISLAAGGDYTLTDSTTTVANIINDDQPRPVITANGPVAFCAGDSVFLVASIEGVASPVYQWYKNGAAISGANDYYYVVKTTGIYTVSSTGSTLLSNPLMITVNAVPSVTATSNSPVQTGSVLNLSSAGAATYEWTGPNGFTSTLQSPAITNVTAANAGDYTVIGTSNGCSATATTTVGVTSACSGIASVSADKNPVCTSSTTTLTANGVTGPSAIVTWFTAANGAGTNLGTGLTLPDRGVGTYYARVTSGCGAPVEKSIVITATALPATPVISSVPAVTTSVCPGTPVTLTAPAATSYLWSSGETSQSMTTTTAGTYTVTVYNVAGCGKTSAIKTVSYSCGAPASAATTAITQTSAKLVWRKVACANAYGLFFRKYLSSTDSLVLVLTDTFYNVSGLTQNTKYDWKVRSICGNNQVSAYKAAAAFTTGAVLKPNLGKDTTVYVCSGTTRSITNLYNTANFTTVSWSPNKADSAGAGVYTLIVSNTGGKDTAIVTVLERSALNPIINAAGPTTFCTGDSVVLSVLNAPYNTYKWSNAATTASIVAKTFGNYTVTVTDNYGCSKTSAPVAVLNSTSTPVITSNPSSTLSLCPNSPVTLTAPASASYMWSTGDTTPSITRTVAGSYTVTVKNGNCSATSAIARVTYLSCGNPLSPTVSYISGSSAMLGWRRNACANYYEVQYRKTGTTVFTTASTYDTAFIATGLLNNTSYEWRVRTICTTTPLSSSGYTALVTFTTNQLITAKPGLGNDTTVFVCPDGLTPINNLYNTAPYAFVNYGTPSPSAAPAGIYSIVVTDYYGKKDTAVATVASRPAMNPVINPSGAVALCAGDSLVLTLLNGPFGFQTWSTGATTNSIVVKSAGSYNVTTTDIYGCSKTANAADVTIASLPAVPTVTTNPANTLNLCPNTVVTYTSSSATKYLWSTGDTAQTITKTVAGSYTVKVFNATNCSTTSAIKRTTYLSCGTPLSPAVSTVTGSTATLTWRRVNCAISYEVQYRRTGTTTFTTISAADTFVNVNNLVAQVSYDWRVRAVCTATPFSASGYTALNTFTTGSGNKGMYVRVAPVAMPIGMPTQEAFSTAIYPNPAKTIANLQLTGKFNDYTLTLSAADGKILWQSQKLSSSMVQLPVADRPSGVYLITVNTGNEKKILKLVIER